MHSLDHILHRLDRASSKWSLAELAAEAELDPAWDPLVADEAAAIAAEVVAATAGLLGAQPGAVAAVSAAGADFARNGYALVMRLVGRPIHETNELFYPEFADALEVLDWDRLLPPRVLVAAGRAARSRSDVGPVAFNRNALLVAAFATGVAAAVIEHDLSTRRP